jgi:phenylalanyl-tRNA synthetase alpha chain
MSAPNSDIDPVQVAALSEAAIGNAVAKALEEIKKTNNLEELKQAKTTHLGDKSLIALANREIGSLPPEAKAIAGKRVATARATLSEFYELRESELVAEYEREILQSQKVDINQVLASPDFSLRKFGSRHPLTQISEIMSDVFIAMGYEIAEGPEAEAEWFNFDSLNIQPSHPSRSLQDTFYLTAMDSGMVLRTQTSPVQMRAMLTRELPLYVVAPGKVFRKDELDATHTPVFHQIEGLAIDKGLSMAHLKGTLDHFATTMFGEGVITRFRPSFFPFTEPSAELDVQCFLCKNQPNSNCRTCKGTGWIEWGGCGMVNPKVLQTAGIDTDVYSGFAFGMGLERTLMFRYSISDMRDMVEGDLRFSAQFGSVLR